MVVYRQLHGEVFAIDVIRKGESSWCQTSPRFLAYNSNMIDGSV